MTISRRELLILPAALRDIFYTGKLAQKNTDTAHNAISVYFYNLCLNLYPFRQASKNPYFTAWLRIRERFLCQSVRPFYMDFRSAISAIFASFRRVSP